MLRIFGREVNKINLGDAEEGYIEFVINGQDITIDIFETLFKIQELIKLRQGNSGNDVLIPDFVEYLKVEHGVTKISFWTAGKVLKAITKAGEDLKKNIGMNVGLPGSSDQA